MKKGFTLIELIIVVVILGVLAAIAYPQFTGMRRRAELREIENIVEIIRAAEKYYRLKQGSWYDEDPDDFEANLRIEISPEVTQYSIEDIAGTKYIEVSSDPDGNGTHTWLYRYDLPDGAATQRNTVASNSDAKFIGFLP